MLKCFLVCQKLSIYLIIFVRLLQKLVVQWTHFNIKNPPKCRLLTHLNPIPQPAMFFLKFSRHNVTWIWADTNFVSLFKKNYLQIFDWRKVSKLSSHIPEHSSLDLRSCKWSVQTPEIFSSEFHNWRILEAKTIQICLAVSHQAEQPAPNLVLSSQEE